MNFALNLRRHRRSIIVITLALAVAGIAAAFSLPVGLFPNVAFPRIVLSLDAGDRPAGQMALQVTTPVEQAVRHVPGVLKVRSVSSRGSAEVSLDFAWGTDMVAALLQVENAVAQNLPTLPAGTTYTAKRMDPTVFPIIAYALTSRNVSPAALYDLAKYQLTPKLSSIPGVARVDVQGGAQAEIEVQVNPQRLAAYDLTLVDVSNALGAANVLAAAGKLEDHDKLYLVLTDSRVANLQDVQDLVVKAGLNGLVRIKDVASVAMGTVPQWTLVDEDGAPAVLFQVLQQPNGNSVQIAKAVQQALAGFAMPAGVKVTNWYDQSVLVTQSAANVRDAILIGLGLAGLVLLAFLRSFKITAIAMIIVPATLAGTVLVLNLAGMSFNIMTLGGLAAAIGLVIDDVIVMIEHISRQAGATRHADTSGRNMAALHAAWEFLPPLTGSSLATIIVLIPLAFLSGVTGAFFKPLSITMGAALVISYLLTALVVPVLARKFIDFEHWRDPHTAEPDRLERWHQSLLTKLLRAPWLTLACLIPLLALGYLAYRNVGTGFMPHMDEGGFVLDYRTAPGTSLGETDRELRQVEAILQATPDVQTFSRRTGLGLGGDLAEPNSGDFFVRLKSGHRRAIDEVMQEVQQKIELEVTGIDVELAQLMEDLIGDLTAVPQPIEIKLFSQDNSKLIPAANKVAEAIKGVAGVIDVKDGVTLAGDALNVKVDPALAALEGMDPSQVQSVLNAYLEGTVATTIPETIKQIGVRVSLLPEMRRYDSQLPLLPIRAPDGHIFPLGKVASFAPDSGQPEISHEDLQQMVAVTARIEGRDLGSTVKDINGVLQKPGALPAGVTYRLGGLYEQQQLAFKGLLKVGLAALMAELVLLLFIYESIWLPLIIIGSALLSMTAVFTGLWLTGIELNITAMMGMIMVMGIATEMAIFYVSEFRNLSREMPAAEALVQAGRNRLRPIIMTSVAAMLTLLPLAFAIGQGSAMQQPLAIAIIAGLILQLPLVLLVMPVAINLTMGAGRTLA